MNAEKYPLLDKIVTPTDLRRLDEEQLPQVADELREYLLQAISKSGGHFSAGLGCVELTVALHYCFETPDDRIIWDVGHQAYPHKILTGRRDRIGTIKKPVDWHPSRNAAKVNLIPLASGTRPLQSVQASEWPWHRLTIKRNDGWYLSSATVP